MPSVNKRRRAHGAYLRLLEQLTNLTHKVQINDLGDRIKKIQDQMEALEKRYKF